MPAGTLNIAFGAPAWNRPLVLISTAMPWHRQMYRATLLTIRLPYGALAALTWTPSTVR